MVPNLSILFMIISIFIGVVIPLVIGIYLIVKHKFKLKCFLLGALCFFLFSSIIEGFLHSYFLISNSYTSNLINNNIILYTLYGAFMAGIFEEVGRFIIMKLLMKSEKSFNDGFIFGLGHGFIEAFLILGLSMATYIMYAFLINGGNFASVISSVPEANKAQLEAIQTSLISAPSANFLLGGIERVFAIIIHIAFSIVVLYGIKTNKIKYLFFAILGHAFVDVPAALFQKGGISVFVVYALLIIDVIILIFIIRKFKEMYKKVNTNSFLK